MARQDLEILIRATNTTDPVFAALRSGLAQVGKDVGAQSGAISSVADEQTRMFAGLSSGVASSRMLWGALAAAPIAVAAAVGAVGTALYQLGMRGSEIQGVKTAFDLLTVSVGGSNAMLAAGRSGTKGLLTDFDLMTNANRLLGAKLPITAAQFGELSGQAIALGRSVGVDAKGAVDRLGLALAKMEPELLDEINIKVSAVDANKKYAASLGVNVTALTAYQRQMAFVTAVQEQARDRTEALGGIQLTFADHLTIVTARAKNLYDQLAIGVAQSPAVITMMERIGASLLDAFGPNQEAAIKNMIGWVDKFALFMIDAASAGVSTARFLGMAWMDLKVAFDDTGAALVRVFEVSAKVQAWQREQMASIPGMGKLYKESATQTRGWATELENLRIGYQTNAETGRASMAKWESNTDGVKKSLAGMRAEMEEASRKGTTHVAVQTAVTKATTGLGDQTDATTTKLKGHAKTVADVAAALKAADRTHASSAMVLEQYGAQIRTLVERARISGEVLPEVFQRWYTEILRNDLTPVLKRMATQFEFTMADVKGARDQFQGLTPAIGLSSQAAVYFTGGLSKLNEQLGIGAVRMDAAKGKTIDLAAGIDEANEAAARLREEFGERTATSIVQSFAGIASGFDGATGQMLRGWTSMFDQMISASKEKGGALWKFMESGMGGKAGAALQVGFESFGQGYSFGSGMGKTGGVLAGAASGAATGAMAGSVVPGLGTAAGAVIGGVAGAVGGYFGGRKKDKEDKAALQDLQNELLKTYGGMDRLKRLASDVGVSIDKAFSSKKPADALKVIDQFSAALDKQKAVMEGLGMAVEGLDLRSSVAFGGNFAALVEQRAKLQAEANNLQTAVAQADAAGSSDADKLRGQYLKVQTELDGVQGKLTGIGATGQAEFDRLGVYAAVNLAGIIKQTGDVRGAFDAVGPTLDQLKTAQEALGVTSSETVDKMLRSRDFAAANAPTLDALSSITQMTKGWGDAGMMTRGLFQTVAGDIGANLQAMTAGAEDVDTALALAGPTLQWLYENQSRYGGITDETTRSLLDQAVAQGLVGDHQKSINQQMLDATLGLSGAVKDLAAFFRGDLPSAASEAAAGIRSKFDGLSFRIPIEYDEGDFEPRRPGGEYQGYAVGGVVPFTPGGRLVRVAERGTERIVSDAQLASILGRAGAMTSGGGGGTVIVRNEIGGRLINETVVDITQEGLRNGQIIVPRKSVQEQVF